MANTLLTIDMITREAVRLWKNTNAFIKNVDHQYDDQFAVGGAKIGDTLRIRLPNDYVTRDGPVVSIQDTAEVKTSLTMSYQKGVDVSFNAIDRTLKLDDVSERVIAPMVNALAGKVASTVMGGVEAGICNFNGNLDGSGNAIAPTMQTWLEAKAILMNNSVPSNRIKAILDPLTMSRTVSSFAGLFNPQGKVGEQYNSGAVSAGSLGMEAWFEDQLVLKHTTAAYSGTKTVNGAGQTGTAIIVNAITGGLKTGDIITFASVNAVNRITKDSTGQLRQFVVTADVASGGTTVNIYPAIVPPVGGSPVQYQTVDAAPGNAATITVVTLASAVYRKNFIFTPEAVTIVSADLWMPDKGVLESARESYDGISMRMISDYLFGTDQAATRLDVLFGYLWIRPEWACVVPDAL